MIWWAEDRARVGLGLVVASVSYFWSVQLFMFWDFRISFKIYFANIRKYFCIIRGIESKVRLSQAIGLGQYCEFCVRDVRMWDQESKHAMMWENSASGRQTNIQKATKIALDNSDFPFYTTACEHSSDHKLQCSTWFRGIPWLLNESTSLFQ